MKKFRKLLAVMSASVMCAVSLTPFVSNATDLYTLHKDINPYTVSFTIGGEEKYVLWQEATDYCKFSEKAMKGLSYIDSSTGEAVTCYDAGINMYISEQSHNGRYYTIGYRYSYYRCADGTTFSRGEICTPNIFSYYHVNDKEREMLESYLTDNNISYEISASYTIILYFEKGTNEYDMLKICSDIKEKTGLKSSWIAPTEAIFFEITDIEYALPEKTLDGDANEDGEVNIADATAIMQHIGNADKYGLTMQGRANADCYNTGDGVTGMDAIAIQKLEAGLIKSLDEA
ncbi:MAG: dockerin type I repeat-containing protein [Ruminococcus sp.]|nr:dockerin type I repeat-containing protein [Ruminococcus sp.]MDE7097922.1 dockerin type I repeat-containing protein [Ruminococcus sp.]